MTINTSTALLIANINFVTRELNRYIPIPLLVFGTIGNTLNILVFSRPLLRTNPCSLYFISASVISFLAIYVGLITPFLGLYDLDPTQTSNVLCKLRFYLRLTAITLTTWFILFACIDRYLSSSTNVTLRSWSSLRIAKRVIFIATIIAFLCPYTQVLFCYTVNQKNVCSYSTYTCRIGVDVVLMLFNSGMPSILIVILSILTIYNIKYLNRINLQNRRNVQLTRILLVQVIVLVLVAVPITVQKLYTYATLSVYKSDLTVAIDSLFSQITIEISYINNSTTFYIYSLTSKKFRKEVSYLFSSLFICRRRRRRKNNIVQPITRKLKSNENNNGNES